MVGVSALRWITRSLYLAQGALVLGTCYAVFSAISGVDLQNAEARSVAEAAVTASAPQALGPLSGYAPLWERGFRQKPFPAEDAVAQPAPPPELPKLLGTFVEQDKVYAQLLTPDGSAKVYAPGQNAGPYEIVAVEARRVCLRRDGDDYWVKLPKTQSNH